MKAELDSQTGNYDIVIPSDYMIEFLYDNDYLQQIDLTKLTNFAADNFLDGVNDIMDQLFVDNADVETPYNVCMPYFWGLFGIMYDNSVEGLGDYIAANDWASIFGVQPAGFGSDISVGVYSVPRFAYAAALLYAASSDAYDVDTTAMNVYSTANLAIAEDVLNDRTYAEWGTDMLKKNIAAGSLDAAFVYVGDFFDTYLILADDAGATTGAEAEAAAANIGIYIPQNTIAFCDAMVIPANADHVDNAHKFIDFFIDPVNAYENSGIVGYTTTLKATYAMIENATYGDVVRQTMVANHPYDPMTVVGVSFSPLLPFTDDENAEIVSMVNRVRILG
jgi:spermidine/putrescine-binding protein